MKKNFLLTTICCLLIIVVGFNANRISDTIASFLENNHKLIILAGNKYTKNRDYLYVQRSKDYKPLSYNDLINIIYSAIDNKWVSFTFYCPNEYTECLKDIEAISNNSLLLTHLNNFVHPYNSFTNLKTSISDTGEVTLKISYLYNEKDIKKINTQVAKIIAENITTEMDDYTKIKTIHDYIINNTRYDITRNETGDSSCNSFKATGALDDHLATCNGYTDTMAIFLAKLNFDNYKIATTPEEISYGSTGHVWNAVYFDNKWLHLDLTWDDPVSEDGKDYLYHKYFLVTNEEMAKADQGEVNIEEHNFNKTIYLEFKE